MPRRARKKTSRARRSKRCSGPATLARADAPSGHGPGQGLSCPSARVVREGLLPGARCALDGHDKDIARSYRKLAKQYHPEPTPGPRTGSRRSRRPMTSSRPRDPQGVRRGPPPRAHGRGFRDTGIWRHLPHGDMGDLGDLFGGLFGAGIAVGTMAPTRRGHRGRAAPLVRRRGARRDHVGERPQDTRCRTCNGSGAAPGLHPCVRPLQWTGHHRRQPRAVLALDRVPEVQRRERWSTPVPTCHGTGSERRNRQVKVRIRRASTTDRGSGEGPRRGPARVWPAGDLYVTVHVGNHERFGRRGRNLTLTVPITFPEAALGTVITCRPWTSR